MIEYFLGAIIIMLMRICDVTIGTVRIIMVSQGKRYYAAFAGFFEVMIWIFAMRYVVQHMDHTINLIGYSIGYSIGNMLGVTVEEKIGIGYLQLNVISRCYAAKIAEILRHSKYGVTVLPGVGNNGDVCLMVVVIRRKDQKSVIKLIETIDPEAFITVKSSVPYRGFIHGSRK